MTSDPTASDGAEFFDDAPCGFVAATADGSITSVNQTFVEMCGIPAEQLVGQRQLTSLMSIGSRMFIETHVAPLLLAAGRVREIALELVTADGGRVPVLVNATLVRDADGAPAAVRVPPCSMPPSDGPTSTSWWPPGHAPRSPRNAAASSSGACRTRSSRRSCR